MIREKSRYVALLLILTTGCSLIERSDDSTTVVGTEVPPLEVETDPEREGLGYAVHGASLQYRPGPSPAERQSVLARHWGKFVGALAIAGATVGAVAYGKSAAERAAAGTAGSIVVETVIPDPVATAPERPDPAAPLRLLTHEELQPLERAGLSSQNISDILKLQDEIVQWRRADVLSRGFSSIIPHLQSGRRKAHTLSVLLRYVPPLNSLPGAEEMADALDDMVRWSEEEEREWEEFFRRPPPVDNRN